jgi:hypothetical protein
MAAMTEHTPTYTTYRHWHGVYCTCGYTYGGGNELAAHLWFDAHLANETMGIPMMEAFEQSSQLESAERGHRVEEALAECRRLMGEDK